MKIQPTFRVTLAPIGEEDQRGQKTFFFQGSTLSSYSGCDCLSPFRWVWNMLYRSFSYLFCGYCCKSGQQNLAENEEMTLQKFQLFFRDNWDANKTFNAVYEEAWNQLNPKLQESLIAECHEILKNRSSNRDSSHAQYSEQELKEMARRILLRPIDAPLNRIPVYHLGKNFEDSTRDLFFEIFKLVEQKERDG